MKNHLWFLTAQLCSARFGRFSPPFWGSIFNSVIKNIVVENLLFSYAQLPTLRDILTL